MARPTCWWVTTPTCCWFTRMWLWSGRPSSPMCPWPFASPTSREYQPPSKHVWCHSFSLRVTDSGTKTVSFWNPFIKESLLQPPGILWNHIFFPVDVKRLILVVFLWLTFSVSILLPFQYLHVSFQKTTPELTAFTLRMTSFRTLTWSLMVRTWY